MLLYHLIHYLEVNQYSFSYDAHFASALTL
jgi:hypothetical protein